MSLNRLVRVNLALELRQYSEGWKENKVKNISFPTLV